MALVVGGVVDQHGDGAVCGGCLRDGGLQCGHISDVAGQEQWAVASGFFHIFAECAGVGALAECDFGALLQEALGQGSTNAGTTAGNKDGLTIQVGVGGQISHRRGPFLEAEIAQFPERILRKNSRAWIVNGFPL